MPLSAPKRQEEQSNQAAAQLIVSALQTLAPGPSTARVTDCLLDALRALESGNEGVPEAHGESVDDPEGGER